ncbi:MAG TPA: CHASE3 domain-containing protein [Bacteroidia bacterium]|nr:CHASE3 domain-containing protein [Bacteroidia bacterium]
MIVSFGKKIVFGFALSMSVFAVIGITSYISGLRYTRSAYWLDHTHKVIHSLDDVISDLRDGETSIRGYVISRDSSFLDLYVKSRNLLPQHLITLRTLLADSKVQSLRADTLSLLANAKMKRLSLFSGSVRMTKDSVTKYMNNNTGKIIMSDARRMVDEMKGEEYTLLRERDRSLKNDVSLNALVNSIGMLGALTLFIALYFMLRNEIRRRNEAEAELLKTNSFLSAVLDNIPNMIFVKDAEHLRFVRINKAGEELLGIPKSELLGKCDLDFFPKEQAEFFRSTDRKLLAEPAMINISEEPIKSRQKGDRWLHTKKIMLADENGTAQFLIGISEDITEVKKQQDAIRQMNQELEAFSYSVSHDLRAPLRGIKSISKILEEQYASRLDEEGLRMLGMLQKTSTTMSSLIQDLLTFAHTGRQEIVKQTVNMTGLARSAYDEAHLLYPESKAVISIAALPEAQADKAMIHLVLVNLLSNSLKFSQNSVSPKIEIGVLNENGVTVYFVKDNGAGFDMKYSDKLFSVFQRLHQQSEFEGTGLGLAIVDRIVTKHGGRVWAEGKTGEGATVYFSLPA